jgi:hypothetical protein
MIPGTVQRGVPETILFGCVGERSLTAGQARPCGVSGNSSWLVLCLGFSRSLLHGGWSRVQRDSLNMLWIDLGLRPVRNSALHLLMQGGGGQHDVPST